jgi:hypothetical protein
MDQRPGLTPRALPSIHRTTAAAVPHTGGGAMVSTGRHHIQGLRTLNRMVLNDAWVPTNTRVQNSPALASRWSRSTLRDGPAVVTNDDEQLEHR